MTRTDPRLVVFSSLYPSQVRPNAGVFVRERMRRVAAHCALAVVSPVPWFPFQGVIRKFKPNYRPQPATYECQDGIDVYFPRFLSLPGLGRRWDGLMMALGSYRTLYRLSRNFGFNLIDAHFAYPDGYAAGWLGRCFHVPVTITLRGTEVPLSKIASRRARLLAALRRAVRVFSVSESLKRHVVSIGAEADKILVVGNGVDTNVFYPLDKVSTRQSLQLNVDAPVLISVGGLVDRKGFHRVIEILPALLAKHPGLRYLIVGGGSPEGDIRQRLEKQVAELGLAEQVRFLGAMPAAALKEVLSAADVFVLATANEGWANVLLEAMACGLPIVTTDVGGNREVVCDDSLGQVVPFGDRDALLKALDAALGRDWDRHAIIAYAAQNAWDQRVAVLVAEFNQLVNRS
ncbi:glycosyltransferase [Methylomonas sp. MED-D]|uniref:glycosyltransferase n=1 Tax=unclassified Methylomonas TaxID=2608980 RepID=UPI0028A33724|nr:glycosyltransferase [Methylomonas sp. MV1]MDT4332301.1 glycosyltransferase [Methylomonas sp. MV1]